MTKEDVQAIMNRIEDMKNLLSTEASKNEYSEELGLVKTKLEELADALYSLKMKKIDEFIDHCILWEKSLIESGHDFGYWSESKTLLTCYGLFGNKVAMIEKSDLMKDDYSRVYFFDQS